MRILMIAPEPFFEPRGTPFSEYHRIRALARAGPYGRSGDLSVRRDVALPGLRVFRCARPPFMNGVGIGPSWRSCRSTWPCWSTACRRALAEKYDAVHSHEEGSWFGVVLAGVLGMPHLYDMHSSLPQQLTNFAYSRSRLVKRSSVRSSASSCGARASSSSSVRSSRSRARNRHGRTVGADRERAGIGRHAGKARARVRCALGLAAASRR